MLYCGMGGNLFIKEQFYFARMRSRSQPAQVPTGYRIIFFILKEPRADVLVSCRSSSKGACDSLSSVERHCQFPSARPGIFMRPSRPQLSRSCNGAMANAALDDHASCINAGAASAA